MGDDSEFDWDKWLSEASEDQPESDKSSAYDEVENIYSDEFLATIAAQYEFNLAETRFKWWIHSGGIRYFLFEDRAKHSSPGKVRRARKQLEKKISELKRFQMLFELKSYERREFKAATPNPFMEEIERVATDAMAHRESLRLERDLFNLRYRNEQLADGVAEKLYELEDYLEELKKNKGGRPADEAAYEFVAYVAEFWTRDLDRPLTIDAHKGEGLTESFRFIRDCAAPLIPISDAKIVTMMRKFRREKC